MASLSCLNKSFTQERSPKADGCAIKPTQVKGMRGNMEHKAPETAAAEPKKKILIVSDAWSPQVNGVVFALNSIKEELEKKGYEVGVIWPDPDKFALRPAPGDAAIKLADTTHYHNKESKVRTQITAFAPDAVYIATPEGPLGMTARRFLVQQGIPFTTGYHTRFPEYAQAKWGVPTEVTFPLARKLHAAAHTVLVPTETMRQTLEAGGLTNTAIMTRGVDQTRFYPQPLPAGHLLEGIEGNVFLYAGRVAEEKNLDAFLKLPLNGTKVVVGDGPDLARLRATYPDVIYTGKMLPQPELAPYMTRANVFVFPSKSDTFGQVMIQALACGTPVAAYPVEGSQDIITDPKFGMVHPDLKTAIEGALAVGKSDSLTAYRREHMAAEYSWPKAAQHMLDNLMFFGRDRWDNVKPDTGIWEQHAERVVRAVRGQGDQNRGR